MRSNKGFTIVELMITFAILAIVVVIFAGAFGSCLRSTGGAMGEQAEQNARHWVASMYSDWQVAGVQAMSVDSDGDGYCSTTVRLTRDDQEQMLALDCRCTLLMRGDGCRLSMPSVVPVMQ